MNVHLKEAPPSVNSKDKPSPPLIVDLLLKFMDQQNVGIRAICVGRNTNACNGLGKNYPSPEELRLFEIYYRETHGVPTNVPFVTPNPNRSP